MSSFALPYAVECAEIAARLEATHVREQMKRGLMGLASISATAAFLGFLGMVIGMMNSFRSIGGSRSAALADLTHRLSQAMVPGILGLAVALIAFWSYQYLTERLQLIDVETQNETINLVNQLLLHLSRLRATDPALGHALSSRPSSSPITPAASDEILAHGLRFTLKPIFRHGVLELIWPSDKELISDAAPWVCVAYGVIAFLVNWPMNSNVSGLISLCFFGYAGWLVQRDPKASVAAVFAYFAALVGMFILSPYCMGWEALFCTLPPLLMLGSWRGAATKKNGPVIRGVSRLALAFLLTGACAVVSVGTVFECYRTGSQDHSMNPGVHAGDWLLAQASSDTSPIFRGELLEVNIYKRDTARVLGLPGDRVQVKGGTLILNGKPIPEPYCIPYQRPDGDFPLPPESHAYVVPKGRYFVLNDNRNHLTDSRTVGTLPRQYLRGPLVLVLSPERRAVVLLKPR